MSRVQSMNDYDVYFVTLTVVEWELHNITN
jgi:hypothetical protein